MLSKKVQYRACVKNENPASAGLKTAGGRTGPGDIDTNGFSIIYEQKFLSIMENVMLGAHKLSGVVAHNLSGLF
jgi:hypothetical protein